MSLRTLDNLVIVFGLIGLVGCLVSFNNGVIYPIMAAVNLSMVAFTLGQRTRY
jgi:hypothetical protein